MGNLCSQLPQVSDHVRSSSGSGRVDKRPGAQAAAPGPEQYCSETTTNAPAASVGTQQSRTPQPQPNGQQAGTGAQHPSVSGSTTTTTTSTTRETRENEKRDGLMPLGQPAIHEEYPLPRHHISNNSSGHEDFSPPQTVPLSWTKGKLIGAGAFGRVFQGLDDDTGQIVAVKQVALTKDETLKGRVAEHVRALEAEVAVLLQLNHRNIVRYLGTERTEDTLNIFLEYVPGGSIASMIEKFGPLRTSVIRLYAQQILKGLEYLHQKKIMHRDIKGANILVDGRGTVKLADFGASKKIENLATVGSGSKSIRGTPYWMAPEVIKQTGHGRPADIWSLACVVIEMATGKPPWSNCHTQVAAMFHIASTKEPPPLPEHLPPEAKDFLLLCFNRVPKDRPNATKLLRHPWMAGCGSTQPSPMKALPMPAPTLPQSQAEPPKQGTELEHGQRHPASPRQHSEAQPADSDIALEGAGSNIGPHGLPPLVPGARTSGHQHSQVEPNQQLQQQKAPQVSTPTVPNATNAAPGPGPQPLFAGPTPAIVTNTKAAGGGAPGRAPSHTPPASVAQPHYALPHQKQQQQARAAPGVPLQPAPTATAAAVTAAAPSAKPMQPTPTTAATAVTPSPPLACPTEPPRPPAAPTSGPPMHAPPSARAHYTPNPSATLGAGGAVIMAQGAAAHTRVPSAGVLAAHRGMQQLPGPTALVGLAQQRTAAPAPGTAGTASPLKGAQLRSMPIPRPSPHMFPQPRPLQQQQQQQPQQQQAPAQSHLQPQPHVAQQQPPKQPQQQQQQPHLQQQQQQQGPVPRAALVSTDFNPMEEPCWGPPGKQRGGDQAIGGVQQHKPQQHPPLHNADNDVPPPTSARCPTAAAAAPAATTNKPRAGGETAAAAAGVAGNAQQQQQRRMYPGPPPLRVPGSQPSQMDQGPFNQERDAMPVKDSKMQNWRDGLIKEMASKRQGGFRPPPGAAAATAK